MRRAAACFDRLWDLHCPVRACVLPTLARSAAAFRATYGRSGTAWRGVAWFAALLQDAACLAEQQSCSLWLMVVYLWRMHWKRKRAVSVRVNELFAAWQ